MEIVLESDVFSVVLAPMAQAILCRSLKQVYPDSRLN